MVTNWLLVTAIGALAVVATSRAVASRRRRPQISKPVPVLPEAVVEVHDGNYHDEVEGATTPVIIDFYATWCSSCHRFAPVLEEVAREYSGRVKFVRIDVERSPDLADSYWVNRYPTVVVLKDARAVGDDGPGKLDEYIRSEGFMDSETFRSFIEEYLRSK